MQNSRKPKTGWIAAGLLLGLLAGTAQAAEYTVGADIGLGYDSNVFRAPDGQYNDLSKLPTDPNFNVNPQTHSGFFVPLSVDASSTFAAGDREWVASYGFDGSLYLNAETNNGNESRHQVKVGRETIFEQRGKRTDSLYIGAVLTRRDKIYVERDDGTEKQSNSINVSDRFTYTGYGLEAILSMRTGALKYGVDAKVESRDYGTVGTQTQYDNNNYKVGGYVGFRLAKPTKLKLSGAYLVEDYSDRHARDLVTANLVTATSLTYSYIKLDATLRQRLAGGFVGYLGYKLKTRSDSHQGYNDYVQNGVDLRLIFKQDAVRIKLAGGYSTRSYDNAFAFENPAAAKKDYSTVTAKLSGTYTMSDSLSLWSEASFRQITTNDTRFEYDRSQLIAGVSWTL